MCLHIVAGTASKRKENQVLMTSFGSGKGKRKITGMTSAVRNYSLCGDN